MDNSSKEFSSYTVSSFGPFEDGNRVLPFSPTDTVVKTSGSYPASIRTKRITESVCPFFYHYY